MNKEDLGSSSLIWDKSLKQLQTDIHYCLTQQDSGYTIKQGDFDSDAK